MLHLQQICYSSAMRKSLTQATIQAWARFIRVEQLLLDKVESDLKAADLPPLVWYDVLLELVRTEEGRLRHKDLHRHMLLAKHNLSRLIDRMEAKGLVSRQSVDDDARGAFIAVSDRGRQMQRRMWPVYARAIQHYFARHLDESDVERLGAILAKLQAP